MIRFRIEGKPLAWRRAQRNRKTGATFTHPEVARLQKAIQAIALGAKSRARVRYLRAPIIASFEFVFPRPKRLGKSGEIEFHTGRPDVDNLSKLILDACEGVLWEGEDSNVSAFKVVKRYAFPTEKAHTICTFGELRISPERMIEWP